MQINKRRLTGLEEHTIDSRVYKLVSGWRLSQKIMNAKGVRENLVLLTCVACRLCADDDATLFGEKCVSQSVRAACVSR